MRAARQIDFEVDLEIDRTYHRRRRNRRARRKSGEMAAPNQPNRPVNPIQMADDRARGIRDYAAPANCNFNPGRVQPTLETERFELKPVMFQMLTTAGQFGGSPAEDPHSHLKSFLDICNKFIIPGVTHEQLQVLLFPYSLRDAAKVWLNQQLANSIATWNDSAEKFLEKYFPPIANSRLRKEIMTFAQMEDETLSEAWERFKSLLQRCPHHGLPLCIQLETFYVGLNKNSQVLVDSSANGALLRKTYDEAHAIFDRIGATIMSGALQKTEEEDLLKPVQEVLRLTH